MVSTITLAREMLIALEQDIIADRNGTAPSPYDFGGYRSATVPVGISNPSQLSLNRGGQILQFLAGYYTAETSGIYKNRIANAAADVYNVFASRPVITSYTVPSSGTSPNVETNGHFVNDPSGALFLLGLMMLDKQGVLDHTHFKTYAVHTTNYIRGTVIPRIAMKANRALYYFDSEKASIPQLLTGTNYTWGTQKMPLAGLNGPCIMSATLSLYSKLYGDTTHSKAYTDAYNLLRLVGTKYSNTYDASNNLVSPTYSGQYPGSKMCVPIGHNMHSRGAFPSIGYNTFVAMAMVIQAFAEKCNTSSTFSNLASLTDNHPLHIDALKIVNYYRDRVATDGELFELGAHRNYAGNASRFRADWKADLVRRGLTDAQAEASFKGSGQFDVLVDPNKYLGRGGYSYLFTWVMPTHSFFDRLADAYDASTGKRMPHINYDTYGTSTPVAKAFAAVGDGVSVRVAAGLGMAMIQGLTSIR